MADGRRTQTDRPSADPIAAAPWAVIGAGVHGLSALKALRQLGVPAVGFERAGEVGGNWNFGAATSRVYESTHTISTKPFTQFPDFPMPASYPDYPSHRQAQEYIQRYASHFGLYDHIKFGCDVVAVEPAGDQVDVTVADLLTDEHSTRRFAGVVIANGHNWSPKLPYYPGLPLFRGQRIHSAEYKSADQVRGKRVLVVGAGNTGCDIAVDAGMSGAIAYHSARRGYWYSPKYAFGRPSDQFADLLLALRVPLEVRRLIFTAVIRIMVGDLTAFGKAKPDHRFYETHPVVNQLLPYAVGHGRVVPKPDIERFDEESVVFVDGSSAEIDMVVFATGYRATFGFIAPELLGADEGGPVLGRQIFSPAHPGVVVSGLIQPDSGQWTLAHWQGMLIAHYARTRRDRPAAAETYFAQVAEQAERRYSGGAQYADSTRHRYEVAHQEYLKALQRDIRILEGSL
jgi:cation diffusion facilitator CzcD-associated flavoprotein CzcO